MQLSRIDLNLFTVFDAIYTRGSITAAARHLHLSQPAVSHALARLRELLDDPLFERRGNEMVPTPMARSLATTVSGSLGTLEAVLQRAGQFEPASTERTFTIAMRDSHEAAVVPALAAALACEAPNASLAVVRIERSGLHDDLLSGQIDVAIDVALPLPADVRRERISESSMMVLARSGHSSVQGSLDLDTYLAADHVLVTGRRRGAGHEDMALGQLGVARRIRVRCQHHTAAAEVVARTDLLLTLPRTQAERVGETGKHQVLPFPVQIPPMELFVYWHAGVDHDPASRWLRETLLGLSLKPTAA